MLSNILNGVCIHNGKIHWDKQVFNGPIKLSITQQLNRKGLGSNLMNEENTLYKWMNSFKVVKSWILICWSVCLHFVMSNQDLVCHWMLNQHAINSYLTHYNICQKLSYNGCYRWLFILLSNALMSTVNNNCYYTVCMTTSVICYYMLHKSLHMRRHYRVFCNLPTSVSHYYI